MASTSTHSNEGLDLCLPVKIIFLGNERRAHAKQHARAHTHTREHLFKRKKHGIVAASCGFPGSHSFFARGVEGGRWTDSLPWQRRATADVYLTDRYLTSRLAALPLLLSRSWWKCQASLGPRQRQLPCQWCSVLDLLSLHRKGCLYARLNTKPLSRQDVPIRFRKSRSYEVLSV